MHKRYLVGIDIGTTNIKAVFIDAIKNKIVSTQLKEIFPIDTGNPDYIEYSTDDWWNYTKEVLRRGFEDGVDPEQVAGICLGGFSVLALLVDENGNPLMNPVHYNDFRHMIDFDELNDLIGEICVEKNGNYLNMFSGVAKQYWWKKHRSEIYEKARYFCTEVTWLNWKLTGAWGWNRVEAGFYSQYNIHTRQWDDEILERAGLKKNMFPKLFDSWETIGAVTKEAAYETGLAQGTLVMGGADDAAPVALTTGVIEDGQCYFAVGSGANIVYNTSRVIIHKTGMLHPHCLPDLNMFVTELSSTGLSYKWARNTFCQEEMAKGEMTGDDPYEHMNKTAKNSKPGSGGVIFLPYLNGNFTPYNDADARGCFIGISGGTSKADILRSVMEGVAFSMLSSLDIIRGNGGEIDEIVIAGGIANSELWLQIISDITQCSITLPHETQGAPFGNALIAGVGSGVYSDYKDAVRKMVKLDRRVIMPNKNNNSLYMEIYKIYEKLYGQLKDTFNSLAKVKNTFDRMLS